MTFVKCRHLKFLSLATLTALVLISPQVLSNPVSSESAITMSEINLFQAAILGMVQGLTEFLPISSTAHLKVVPVALGWGDPGVALTAVLQLGSMVAVFWYFWEDLRQISQGAWQAVRQSDYQVPEFQLALGIGLGTLPIVAVGVLIKLFVADFDNSPLRSLTVISLASVIMALLLGVAEWLGKRQRHFGQLTVQDGIWIGVAQALAIIPGVSRSGATLTAGLGLGLERAAAARFSFLLGIPAITLAGLVELKGLFSTGLTTIGIGPLLIGLLSSGLFSYIAIAWLIRFLQTQNTWVFVWYRLTFGIAILGTISIGILPNS